jgi:hypothetical protein
MGPHLSQGLIVAIVLGALLVPTGLLGWLGAHLESPRLLRAYEVCRRVAACIQRDHASS